MQRDKYLAPNPIPPTHPPTAARATKKNSQEWHYMIRLEISRYGMVGLIRSFVVFLGNSGDLQLVAWGTVPVRVLAVTVPVLVSEDRDLRKKK